MALAAEIVWEFRTTGNNDNGGGFKTGASGTDYSQQDAAQLTLSDLAMTTGGTTLTSATGGFTDAMIGNVIYIKSGTNFTAGWYEITARADTNTVTLDRDATNGSNASSGTGSVGGAIAVPTDAFFEALTAGNTVYFKKGTYVFTENISITTVSGTTTAIISLIGYNSSRTDAPVGDNRPLFTMADYVLYLLDYFHIKNIIMTGSGNPSVRINQSSIIINCKSINNSGTANRAAIYLNDYDCKAIDCEAVSFSGHAIITGFAPNYIMSCYCHDSVNGINAGNLETIAAFCIFDNCTNGININSRSRALILNNTIYKCTTGISGTTGNSSIFLNNIIDTCTNGASWDANYLSSLWDYNNWHGNDTDVSNVTKGANATANDPEFEFVGVRGTDDSGVDDKATSMVDTSENFTTLGVSVGDTILNKTDGSWGTITSISTTTNPNDTVNFSGGLTGGTDNDFDNGDTYSILGNFSLKSTSDCIGAGFGIRLGVGA